MTATSLDPSAARVTELRERCTADVWIGVTQEEARELLADLYGFRAREHALCEELSEARETIAGLMNDVDELRAAKAGA